MSPIVVQQFILLLIPILTIVVCASVAMKLNESSQASVVAELGGADGAARDKLLASMVKQARIRLGGSAAIAVVLLLFLTQVPGLSSLFSITPAGTALVHTNSIDEADRLASELLGNHLRPLNTALDASDVCREYSSRTRAAIVTVETLQSTIHQLHEDAHSSIANEISDSPARTDK